MIRFHKLCSKSLHSKFSIWHSKLISLRIGCTPLRIDCREMFFTKDAVFRYDKEICYFWENFFSLFCYDRMPSGVLRSVRSILKGVSLLCHMGDLSPAQPFVLRKSSQVFATWNLEILSHFIKIRINFLLLLAKENNCSWMILTVLGKDLHLTKRKRSFVEQLYIHESPMCYFIASKYPSFSCRHCPCVITASEDEICWFSK